MKHIKEINTQDFAYCPYCGDLIPFDTQDKIIVEDFKGKTIMYPFVIGICKKCGAEVATDIYYMERKSKAKIAAYNALGGDQLRVE